MEENINNSNNGGGVSSENTTPNTQSGKTIKSSTKSGGTFIPNICFNFATGEGHLGAGKIKFSNDGITLSNININDSIVAGSVVYDSSIPQYMQVTSQNVICDLSSGGYTYLYVPTTRFGGKMDLKMNQAINVTIINLSADTVDVGVSGSGTLNQQGTIWCYRKSTWTGTWPTSAEATAVNTIVAARYCPVDFIFIPTSVNALKYEGTWIVKNPWDYQLYYHVNGADFLKWELVPKDGTDTINK